METVPETAARLFELHSRVDELQAAFNEADRLYLAGDGGPAAATARADSGAALNMAIVAGAELRRLAARHPGYFADGWRESPDMIPQPLTDAERLERLRERADAAQQKESEREAGRRREMSEERARRKEAVQKLRDDRRRASEAAGHVRPENDQASGQASTPAKKPTPKKPKPTTTD